MSYVFRLILSNGLAFVCFLFVSFRDCTVPGAAEDQVCATDGFGEVDCFLCVGDQAGSFLFHSEHFVRDAVPDGLHRGDGETAVLFNLLCESFCLGDVVIGSILNDPGGGDFQT